MSEAERWAWAAVAILAWLALAAASAWGAVRARRAEKRRGRGPAGAVLVAYASQTGLAEELARVTAGAFEASGAAARLVSFRDLTPEAMIQAGRVLLVVSTTGEGDPPDAAARFVRTAMTDGPDLSRVEYGLLSLGDREYKDFCGFGRAVETWLLGAGARPLFDTVEVDDADAEAIGVWRRQVASLTGGGQPDWTPRPFAEARLIERHRINPGSPGGEAWIVAVEPPTGADWSAGDILEVGVAGPDGQVVREYSIATVPTEGRIELLVRRMTREDGSPGLASGWLTEGAAVGAALPVRVRVNRAFHAPELGAPLILIGNGTGIAGLRAHIAAREDAPGPTWLLFGERTRAHDAFYDADLSRWLAAGMLTRLDRAFSRDADCGRYVQHLVAEAGRELADWVDRGATILVCGSLQGMAPAVEAALVEGLGAERVQALREAGRYRRDVY